jgi:hypothetical protein
MLVRHIWSKNHFFEGIVDASDYLHIFSQSVEQLGHLELTESYCYQVGATCQHSRGSTAMIQGFLEDRFTSKDLWPLGSPDVRLTDFFFCGFVLRKGCSIMKQA